jgi:uncharacterized protein YcbK (DUF882 family)
VPDRDFSEQEKGYAVMFAEPRQNTLATGSISRRRFLQLSVGTLIAGASLAPELAWAKRQKPETVEKKLDLYNYHTAERVKAVYWAEGDYVSETINEINHVLRDRRTDEATDMDPKLLDLLFDSAQKIEARDPFYIVSAYRSPKTNARLRLRRKGVAKNSQHIYGKAADFYIPGRNLSYVRKAALSLHCGGVGYYPSSHFIHVDTGPVRSWRFSGR